MHSLIAAAAAVAAHRCRCKATIDTHHPLTTLLLIQAAVTISAEPTELSTAVTESTRVHCGAAALCGPTPPSSVCHAVPADSHHGHTDELPLVLRLPLQGEQGCAVELELPAAQPHHRLQPWLLHEPAHGHRRLRGHHRAPGAALQVGGAAECAAVWGVCSSVVRGMQLLVASCTFLMAIRRPPGAAPLKWG